MDRIRKLLNERHLGGMLPAMKFFEPKARFLRWMKRGYANSVIYDVGAGIGHVAKALSEQGQKVLAIDLNYRETEENFPVLIADGESYEYQANSVVMVCRPCHGRFMEEVIAQAIRQKVAAILYVGLEKNVESDLSIYRGKFEHVLTGAGLEGEEVWKSVL